MLKYQFRNSLNFPTATVYGAAKLTEACCRRLLGHIDQILL